MDELYVICRTVEIDDRDVKGFVLMREGENGEPKPWPIMITRKCNQFYGYENACPHQGERLDTTPGQFLDEDENFITCGNHQAQFDPDTGEWRHRAHNRADVLRLGEQVYDERLASMVWRHLETMQRAYRHAIAAGYRFYSYGDACLLFPA